MDDESGDDDKDGVTNESGGVTISMTVML